MNHITPIIYTTEYCNMACKYCYAGSAWKYPFAKEINENFRLKLPSLFKFINEVMSYNKFVHTKFIFHGGEPLLIKPENYKKVFEYFRKENYDIEISIQTNGTLINNAFINLFKEFNVKVGVSLDGPLSLNDCTRIFKNGNGSFCTIFNNLKKMKYENLKFGCLVTLNKTNTKNIDEIYTFFKENDIPFNIRPIFKTKYTVPKEFLITPQEYAKSFCKLFDIWFEDETENLLIDEFASMIAQFIKPIEGLVSCAFTKKCSEHFISFDMDGNLYPCDRLYGIPKFLYGNIQKYSLKNLLNSSKAKNLSKRWEILSKTECKNCEILKYCYGGCPGNGYFYYGSYFKRDYYCKAFRMILSHIYERVKSSLRNKVD
ncbi:MAG TPA: radical SAM protein [Caldisericia bacterium]|nr:radical SAM protein [Caldisericia bacterium]